LAIASPNLYARGASFATKTRRAERRGAPPVVRPLRV
jgi:hypothetical protein